jgi:hypothetical protein
MKKILVSLFLILTLTAGLLLGSCAEPQVKTTVTLTVKVGEYTLVNAESITVSTAPDNANGPSVLDVVKAYMDAHTNINIQISETSLTRFTMYYETTYQDIDYYWQYTINGEEPEGGKASTNYVKADDLVEYRLVAMSTDANGKVVVSDYDTESNIFEEELSEENSDAEE